MANWGESFSQAFTSAQERAMILAAEREKEAQTQKQTTAQKAIENMLAAKKLLGEEQLGMLKYGLQPSPNLQGMLETDPIKDSKYIAGSKGLASVGLATGIPYVKAKSVSPTAWVFDPQTGEYSPTKSPISKGDVVRNKQLSPEERAKQVQTAKLGEIPAGETGRYTLAREAIKSVGSARRTLFPDGTAKSFKRATLQKAALASKGVAVGDKDAQNLSRWLTTSISARQLIQTGVAARPEETQMLVQQFLGNALTNPESMMVGLKQLEDFYKDYNNTLRTKGLDGEKEISTKSVFKGVSKSGKPYERYEDGSIKWL